MNRVNTIKTEDRMTSSSNSEGSQDGHPSSPSNVGSKKDELGDDPNSQDDVKSDQGVNAGSNRMGLRDRRKRTRPNYRFSPEMSPAPAPAVERRVLPKTEKSSTAGMNASAELSHWLQCDACQKWRIVAHKLFEDLKKLSHFQCRNLQGVTCKDKDDWGKGASDDASVKDDSSMAGFYSRASKARARQPRRVNIFAGRYIPGFAGEFSDLGEE